MELKYTRQFLSKLEAIFTESDYVLRYEKGNFKAGFCVLKDTRLVILNKYFPLEGKINCLCDISKNLEIDPSRLTAQSRQLYQAICSKELIP